MKTQKAELVRRLPRHGWDITHVEEDGLDWWADEMWLLESVWSPVGTKAYVTFLYDPFLNNYGGIEKRHVWAVMASAEKPADWHHSEYEEGYFTMFLKGWEKELPDFFAFLKRLRDAGDD